MVAVRVVARGSVDIVSWVGVIPSCLTVTTKGDLRAGRTVKMPIVEDTVLIGIGNDVAIRAAHRVVSCARRQVVLMCTNTSKCGIAIAVQIQRGSGLQYDLQVAEPSIHAARVHVDCAVRVPVTGSALT